MEDHPTKVIKSSNLINILQIGAKNHPNVNIFNYLVDGETKELNISYNQLDIRAKAIAANLQSLGQIGDRAILLYTPGLEFITAFFGCLYSRIIAVPVYPPLPARLKQSLMKIASIANDAKPQIVLTTSSIIHLAKVLVRQVPVLKNLRWLATDKIADDSSINWEEPEISSDSLAFLQYTSGSTSTPRGVMISHGNLMYNLKLIQQRFEHTSNSRGVIWLPPYHDMGLIGGILQPLYCGFPVTLMSPIIFLQRPFRWLKAISRFKATTSGGPNFAYDLCVRKITPEDRSTLDLSTWDLAFNGAEPINRETLERFATYFECCGFRKEAFYPCYGLAEATLIVSGGLKAKPPVIKSFQASALKQKKVISKTNNNEDSQMLVGCGKSMEGQKIVIVDPEFLRLCKQNEIGEIWVSGPSVAQGYWNNQKETIETFYAYFDDSEKGPFLRTGDMGFLHDGELFVTGRLKDLIIIEGSNHYPQDIESTVEISHPAIRRGCCAAFSIEVENKEQLVVIAEVETRSKPIRFRPNVDMLPNLKFSHSLKLDAKAISMAIRKAVAERHDIRIYDLVLLKERSIPKTSSGKIQRYVCKAEYLEGTLNVLK